MNLNRIILIGRLTRDPESRTLPSGQTVSNFGLATNRVWTNPETNERQEQTEFHNIVAFGKLADICNQYLKKGSLAMIEGRIQTRSWQDQNGDTKYRTEIIAEGVQLGPKPAGKSEKQQESSPETGTDQESEEKIPEVQVDEDEVKSEDIPF